VAVNVTLAPVTGVVVELVSVVVVDVRLDPVTVTLTALDVLSAYVLDPPYVAVIA
jgi:hypothetical protein